MAKQVFLLADTATGVVGSFLRQAMLDDLLAVSRVPVEALQELADRLEREPGFLTPTRLAELIRYVVPDEPAAEAVENTLNGVRPGYVTGIAQDLRAFREVNPRNGELLSAEALAAIEARLDILVHNYASLERYRKAAALTESTGNQFEGVDLICDLRPVFDTSRAVIEGFLPRIVIRLKYRALNSSHQAVEIGLSVSDLDVVIREAEKAKRKLETMQQLADGRLPGGWVELE